MEIDRLKSLTRKGKGNLAENIACEWLNKNGFKIIKRNYKVFNIGEIDIICKKWNCYYFVEVKSSSGEIKPEEHFTISKLDKIVKLSNYIATREKFKMWRIALFVVEIKKEEVQIRFYDEISQTN